ncbi:MAG: hypothetical protein AAF959_14910 [Cyanobacteria bacterium P01_D01_bin.56]
MVTDIRQLEQSLMMLGIFPTSSSSVNKAVPLQQRLASYKQNFSQFTQWG